MFISHKRSSVIKGRLPSKAVSIKGHLTSKVVFHQMSYSIKVCLLSKGDLHQRFDQIKSMWNVVDFGGVLPVLVKGLKESQLFALTLGVWEQFPFPAVVRIIFLVQKIVNFFFTKIRTIKYNLISDQFYFFGFVSKNTIICAGWNAATHAKMSFDKTQGNLLINKIHSRHSLDTV